MPDVYIFQTADGGEIERDVTLIDCQDSAIYLSMFGGRDWWGSEEYTAETGALFDSLPLTSANLRRIEAAVLRDLAWLGGGVDIRVYSPSRGFLQIDIDLDGRTVSICKNQGDESVYNFSRSYVGAAGFSEAADVAAGAGEVAEGLPAPDPDPCAPTHMGPTYWSTTYATYTP